MLDKRMSVQQDSVSFEAAAAPATSAIGRLRALRPAVLMVTHALGGGTEKHVQDLCRLLEAEGVQAAILRGRGKGEVTLEAAGPLEIPPLRYSLPQDRDRLFSDLLALNLEHVHVHHILGLPAEVLQAIRGLGLSYDFTAHDYLAICPRINLMDGNGRYCGEPEPEACDRCVRAHGSQAGKEVPVARWRAQYLDLLSYARRVFVPCEDVEKRLRRYFPDLPYRVRPHPEPAEARLARARPIEGLPARIALIGAVGATHKGSAVLAACARDALARALPLEFHVLGTLGSAKKLLDLPNVIGHGAYEEADIPAWLEKARCHAAFFPAPWPETWSYTLSHALRAGLPILAYDFGAMAERLKGRPDAALAGLDAPPSMLNDRLLELARCEDAGPPFEAARYTVESYYERRFRAGVTPWEATLRKAQRMLIQGLTLRPQVAMLEKRMLEPARFLASVPGVRVSMSQNAKMSPPRAEEGRILILQRLTLAGGVGIAKLRALLTRGYVVVQEFDDDPRRWPHHLAAENLSFRGVHAVQTSTETLADLLRAQNPEVAVFPNQMAELPPPRVYAEGPPRLFFGALNREEDWAPLIPELNRVLAEHPGVRVAVIHDRAFFQALETANKVFSPACGYTRYQAILRGCDIGILPLSDTPFNRCKSDLKFIECAAHGVAVLASPVVYGDSLRPGETGLLFHDPESFGRELRRLITDAPLRRRIARQAYEYVMRERLQIHHYRDRYEWYRRLVEEKPRLDEALRARAPELFA